MYDTQEKIFCAMQAIVEAPGYQLLQHYKDDFYKLDKEKLERGWTAKSRAIWVVTPNGTHLTWIGQHRNQAQWVQATVNCGYKNIDIFLLSAKGIKRLNTQQAIDCAKETEVCIEGGSIRDKSGRLIATMHVNLSGAQNTTATVHFDAAQGSDIHSKALQLLLRVIALEEAVVTHGSLFTKVSLITVDRHVITDVGLVEIPDLLDGDDYVIRKSVSTTDSCIKPKLYFDGKGGWIEMLAKAKTYPVKPKNLLRDTDCIKKQRALQEEVALAFF